MSDVGSVVYTAYYPYQHTHFFGYAQFLLADGLFEIFETEERAVHLQKEAEKNDARTKIKEELNQKRLKKQKMKQQIGGLSHTLISMLNMNLNNISKPKMDESKFSCVQDGTQLSGKVWIVTPKVLNEVEEPEGGGIGAYLFTLQREDLVGSAAYSDFRFIKRRKEKAEMLLQLEKAALEEQVEVAADSAIEAPVPNEDQP